ncbi:MAG: hypothetical protein JW741_19325 [Sedimentisphaerales bacterium]|nr:hypothetical protein [Sedimentisphaerales bacterium]
MPAISSSKETDMPRTIAVTGDTAIDWISYPVEGKAAGDNWQLHDSYHYDALGGGAILLAQFIERILAKEYGAVGVVVQGPREPATIKAVPPSGMIHSNVILGGVPKTMGRKARDVLRVDRFLGYMGPSGDGLPAGPSKPVALNGAEMLVIDDAGNGFRSNRKAWPFDPEKEADALADTVVIYKMSRPLADGPLWKAIVKAPKKDWVVVVNACDLRCMQGVRISRSLSWERTAKDFVYEMLRVGSCTELQKCPNLVVLFGYEGVILYSGQDKQDGCIFYEKSMLEGDVQSCVPGAMVGGRSLLTATLATEIIGRGSVDEGLRQGIVLGLRRARALLTAGFCLDSSDASHPLRYPLESVLEEKITPVPPMALRCCPIDMSHRLEQSEPRGWRILDSVTSRKRRLVAAALVTDGDIPKELDAAPELVIGKFSTRDRYEIEHTRAIRELIDEYLANRNPEHPLCFAVFGPPGSGKSFAVKQMVKGMEAMGLVSRTYNISQMDGPSDLIKVFQEIRDIRLEGNVPFAFFDEFDGKLNEKPLGWLSQFLAPMQDGKFTDSGVVHPIGKAVFAFAGGVYDNYAAFIANKASNTVATRESLTPKEQFRAAKGPDFESRLRGHINVMGPDRQVTEQDDDEAFVLRRAHLLRVHLELDPTAVGLKRPDGAISMDEGLVRAFLYVRRFRHGVRSISAIIEMSRLSGKAHYDQSCLPDEAQLNMHVDADEFLWLCERERFQSLLRRRDWIGDPDRPFREVEWDFVEPLASMVQGDYRKKRRESDQHAPNSDPYGHLKRSNIDAAAHVPSKLLFAGYTLRKVVPEIHHLMDMIKKHQPPFAEHDIVKLFSSAVLQEMARISGIRPHTPITELQELLEDGNCLSDAQHHALASYAARATVGNRAPVTVSKVIKRLQEADPGLDVTSALDRLAMEDGVDGSPPFTREQVIELAKMEHDRYCRERALAGYRYADIPRTDNDGLRSPFLAPFERLPLDVALYDIEAVEALPRILAELGYVMHPMQSAAKHCNCSLNRLSMR